MKWHERGELLTCARRVAATLGVSPADVPIEGYYGEDEDLAEFQRLCHVAAAPLHGPEHARDGLLPVGRDALTQALRATLPDWSVPRLRTVAHDAARDTDDISLVGLAARARDAVVLTAARESVVLYAEIVTWGVAPEEPPPPRYEWAVGPELVRQATRFVDGRGFSPTAFPWHLQAVK
jgi:hypothetical protein